MKRHVALILIAGLLNGCSTSTVEPPPTATLPTIETQATETPQPTEASTAEVEPTSTMVNFTPYEFNQTPLLTSFPNCSLPCWNGLRLHNTTEDQVRSFLKRNHESDELDRYFVHRENMNIDSTILSLEWTEDTTNNYFLYSFYFQPSNKVLQGISFRTSGSSEYPTVQDYIAIVGTPERIDVATQGIGLNLALFYETGTVLFFRLDPFSSQIRKTDDLTVYDTIICFDQPPTTIQEVIVEPFTDIDNRDAWNPLQDLLVGSVVDNREFYAPITDELNLTIKEFEEVVNSENPCIQFTQRI